MALKNLMGDVATDDSLAMLRRLCDLLESGSVVDAGGRQRVIVDNTVPVTVSSGTITTVSNIAAVANFLNQDHRQLIEPTRVAWNTGIRAHLKFS